MEIVSLKWNPRGSEWHRWDPHIHAPGTALNNQFGGDWDDYLSAIENATPKVKALGVTDYYGIETYREIRKLKTSGRLQDVNLIFPNVEMRLETKTKVGRGINIHLIFSPETDDHEQQIEQMLGSLSFEYKEEPYTCNRQRLIASGRAFNSTLTSDSTAYSEGVNQFKVTFTELKKLFRNSAWIRENCLVAVPAGPGDGLSGLKQDDSFTALREEMQRFAHIIFSGNPGDRDFWIGKKSGYDRDFLDEKYKGPKPCLHGCDAHDISKVLRPDEGRICWIKGDIAFESLRQAVIEPEERVWIGPNPPLPPADSNTIDLIRPDNTPWLKSPEIVLNGGLIAVIGARGSGKTALIDLVAAGAGALPNPLSDSSFLKRATQPEDLIGNASVTELWKDGTTRKESFSPPSSWEIEANRPEVCYLSQQFVDRLCSAGGLARELRQEIERVIFEQTESDKRFEATNFEELSGIFLNPIRHRRNQQIELISTYSDKISEEISLQEQIPKLESEKDQIKTTLIKQNEELQSLLPKDQEQKTKKLLDLETACSTTEAAIDRLKRQIKKLEELFAESLYFKEHKEPQRFSALRRDYSEADLRDEEWENFKMTFAGDIEKTINIAKREAQKKIDFLINGDSSKPPTSDQTLKDWPLIQLREQREIAKKEVGVAIEKRKAYETLQKVIASSTLKLKKLEASIANAKSANVRKDEARQARKLAYREVFETFIQEERILKELYEPLHEQISGAAGSLGKLRFVVKRRVRIDDWVSQGEQLLDLRKSSKFRGHGELKREVSKALQQTWRESEPNETSLALDEFVIGNREEFLRAMPSFSAPEEKASWQKNIGKWLFDTSHISIQYGLEYDGISIEQLSPGTRGIVLLLLYLAVDKTDLRPLLIDQPEENLDPKSVFEDLVPHFREARRRRQVIIVTHNANLVVNTDADQVIVASSAPAEKGGLPDITYKSGSLENPRIRHLVCDILEGGKRAFLERERRYRLQWEQMLNDVDSPNQ